MIKKTLLNPQPNKELQQDIIQWDTENWGNLIPLWNEHLDTVQPLHCLEIGAKRGGLSLWVALNRHTVICSDIKNPQEIARPLHIKYNINKGIGYQAINILNIPYHNHFDIVFLKSILASVARNNQKELQKKAVNSIYQSLKPGGKLLFAENLTATKAHSFARKKFITWGVHTRYVQLEEMLEYLKDFKTVTYQTYGFFGAFGRTEKQRRLLGKLDSLINCIIPQSWNYLVIGSATK